MQKKRGISGKAYIIIGGFVTGYSFFVTLVSKQTAVQKFSFFILAGVVFMVVGIMKLLLGASEKTKQIPKPTQPSQQHVKIKYCSNCGTPTNYNDRFCRMCGGHQFFLR